MDDFDTMVDDISKAGSMIQEPLETVFPIFVDWYNKVGGFEGIMNKIVSDIESVTSKDFLETSEEENLKALIEVNNKYNEREDII